MVWSGWGTDGHAIIADHALVADEGGTIQVHVMCFDQNQCY
jgi:hypothetical protein